LRQAWDATIKRSLNLGVPFEKSRLQFLFAKIESRTWACFFAIPRYGPCVRDLGPAKQ
jgi:hypothetical protein